MITLKSLYIKVSKVSKNIWKF